MSTAVLSSPPVSASGLVQSLSPEMREDVFILLLRELIGMQERAAQIPVIDSDGELVGVVIPPAAEAARAAKIRAEMPPEVRAAFNRSLEDLDLDDSIPAEEFLEQLKRADAARSRG